MTLIPRKYGKTVKRGRKGESEITKKLMIMAAAVAVVFGAWAETETVGGSKLIFALAKRAII